MTNKKSTKEKKNKTEVEEDKTLQKTAYLSVGMIIFILFLSFFVFFVRKPSEVKPKQRFRTMNRGNPNVNSQDQQSETPRGMNYEGLKENLIENTKNILSFGTRVIMSEGHLKTQQYIISKLKSFDFQVTLDTFETDTIIGKKTFTNIIASHKNTSHIKNKMVLAAHYESKIFEEFEFLGAIDSVVSCSMLLEFARFIDYHIDKFDKTDIQLIFFDGEEAFKEWTETDSIYGAKHLASKWKSEDKLNDISIFVLLDLIGTKETNFLNHQIHYATGTNQLFLKFIEIENHLRSSKSLMTKEAIFKNINQKTFIGDDHEPFAKLGVPIVHLTPIPFPKVWHTKEDNFQIVDWMRTTDITLILNVFISVVSTS